MEHSGVTLSRTRKDSKKSHRTVLEVVKRNESMFDLFLNQELDRTRIPEQGLPKELCVRFGFCGEEYNSILNEVNQNGRKTVVFG